MKSELKTFAEKENSDVKGGGSDMQITKRAEFWNLFGYLPAGRQVVSCFLIITPSS